MFFLMINFVYFSVLVLLILSLIALSYWQKKYFKKEVPFRSRSIFYEVEDSKGTLVGYVMAVFHEGFPESFTQGLNDAISPFLKSSEVLMVESESFLSPDNKDKSLFYFSSNNQSSLKIQVLETQQRQLLIYNSIVSFGPFCFKIPRAGLHYLESLFLLLLNVVLYVPDKILQFVFFSRQIDKKIKDVRLELRSLYSYMDKQIISDSLEGHHAYFLELKWRNEEFYKALVEHRESSQDRKFFMCLSAAHLTYDKGILNLLVKSGYRVIPRRLNLPIIEKFKSQVKEYAQESLASM